VGLKALVIIGALKVGIGLWWLKCLLAGVDLRLQGLLDVVGLLGLKGLLAIVGLLGLKERTVGLLGVSIERRGSCCAHLWQHKTGQNNCYNW